jgi:hypothetical protein
MAKTTKTNGIDAKTVARESYLATLGAGQLALETGRKLSTTAARYARRGRSSAETTVRDLVRRGEKVLRTVRSSDVARRTATQARTIRSQATAVGRQTTEAVVTVREALAGSYGSSRSSGSARATSGPRRATKPRGASASRGASRPKARRSAGSRSASARG